MFSILVPGLYLHRNTGLLKYVHLIADFLAPDAKTAISFVPQFLASGSTFNIGSLGVELFRRIGRDRRPDPMFGPAVPPPHATCPKWVPRNRRFPTALGGATIEIRSLIS